MKFGAVMADPPWNFRNWTVGGQRKNAKRHYTCLSVEQLRTFHVQSLAARDCVLFLWVTGPFIVDAARLARAWGFKHYSGVAFTWIKKNPVTEKYHFGPGYWTRHNAEFCLLFTRGGPKRLDAGVPELVVAPRGAHSEKPEEVARRIERLVAGPYVELFARRERAGWTCLGLELTGRDLADDIGRVADQPSLALEVGA